MKPSLKRKQQDDDLDQHQRFNSTGLSFSNNNRKVFSSVNNNLNVGNGSSITGSTTTALNLNALTPPTTPQSENSISLPNRIKQIQNNNQLSNRSSNVLTNRQASLNNSSTNVDQLLLNSGLNNSYSSNDLLINQNQLIPTSTSQDQQMTTDYQSVFPAAAQQTFLNQTQLNELSNCDTNLLNLNHNNEHNLLEQNNGEMESSSTNNFCFNSLYNNPATATNSPFTTINNSFNIYNNGYLANFSPHHTPNNVSSNSTNSPYNNPYNNYLEQTNGNSSINSITAWSNRYISSLHQNALNENTINKTVASSNASSPSSLSSSSASILNVAKNNSSSTVNDVNSDVFNSEQLLDLNQHNHHLQLENQFINESNHHLAFSSSSANQLLLTNNQPDFCSTYSNGQTSSYLHPNWNYS